MGKNPKVSVIMPAYNAESYIREAIESILNQTFKDFELIVINDCSTDRTREIVKEFGSKDNRVKLVDNKKNLRIAKTLNAGLKVARGKYIARMDADDYSYPERIDKQVTLLDSNSQLSLISGNMDICDEDLNIKTRSHFPLKDTRIRNVLLQFNPMVSPAMMWRKEISDNVGGFNTDILTEDYMFIMDMSSKGQLENLDDSLLKYRVLNKSFTSTKMQEAHLSTILVALIGHFKYKYPLSFKTKMLILVRMLVAYFIPPTIWRFISTILRR